MKMFTKNYKNIIEKTKKLILNPSKLYESVKNEKLEDSFKYLFLSSLPLFFQLLLFLLIFGKISEQMEHIYVNLPLVLIIYPPLFYFIVIGRTIRDLIVIYLLCWIIEKKKEIDETFKVVMYRQAFILISLFFFPIFFILPFYNIQIALAIIFFVSIFIYSAYILVKGISIYHKISSIRSILICLPCILIEILDFSILSLFLLTLIVAIF